MITGYKGDAAIVSPEGENLKSLRSDTKIEIEFENRLNETVVVYWLNFSGGREEYFRLPPGKKHKQQTFVTHPWVILKQGTNEEVGRIVVDPSARKFVISEK